MSTRTLSNTLAGSLIAAAFVVPCAALAFGLWVLQAPTAIDEPIQPLTMPIAQENFWDEQRVSISVTWGDGDALVAPTWNGMVTNVAVAPGAKVSHGAKVLRIDGVWRLAARSPAPFFRPVSPESGKEEIRALNMLLDSLGYSNGGDLWTWDTTLGLRRLAADLGVPDAYTVAAFDPGWVLWLPSDELIVSEVLVAPGRAALPMGEKVLAGVPRISALSVVSADDAPLPDPSADWEIAIDELTIPYESARIARPDRLGEVSERFAAARPEQISGSVRRAQPVVGWQVPSSAVFVDEAGEVCVFRPGQDGEWVAVDVVANGGTVGKVRVVGAVHPDVRILVNPGDVVGDTRCR